MEEINVLSYNVSWEAMSSKNTPGVQGSKCYPTNCKDNVTALIKKNVIDENINLIGIQESGLLQDIVIPHFEKITWQKKQYPSSNAMTMYDTRIFNNITDKYFNLNDPWHPTKKHIIGNIAAEKNNPGDRPYQIIILEHIPTKKNLLFTNLHNDHYNTIPLSLDVLTAKFNASAKLGIAIHFDYGIITGDFNATLGKQINVYNANYDSYTLPATCCDSTLNGKKMYTRTDYILTSGFTPGTIKTILEEKNNILYSDHLPVVLKLTAEKKIIGYDFDGVLHKNISSTDLNGQRHPDGSSFDKLIPFDKIITQIKTQIDEGNIIHIISANPDKLKKENFINLYFDPKYIPNIKIIPPALTKNSDILKTVDFYDDSANVLIDFLKANPATSVNLYFVIPELDSYYQVKNQGEVQHYFLILQILLLAKESTKINTGISSDRTEYDNLKGAIFMSLL